MPVKLVHINKCPVLAPANTLRPEDAERLGIDRQHCLDNLKRLRENPQVREKVVAIFAEAEIPQWPKYPGTSSTLLVRRKTRPRRCKSGARSSADARSRCQ